MPTYDYACNDCGHRLEATQKIADAPLTECPACHQPTLKRVISATGIVFKGSGWNRPAPKNNQRPKDDGPPPACGAGGCSSCALE